MAVLLTCVVPELPRPKGVPLRAATGTSPHSVFFTCTTVVVWFSVGDWVVVVDENDWLPARTQAVPLQYCMLPAMPGVTRLFVKQTLALPVEIPMIMTSKKIADEALNWPRPRGAAVVWF